MSESQKKKISKTLEGHLVSKKTKEQCGNIWKGKHPPTEFKKGHPASETAFKKGHTPWSKNNKLPQFSGKNSPSWKGKKAGYGPKHTWIYRQKGKPMVCQHCNTTNQEKRLEWANINHKYSRNINDYIPLCKVCHIKYDKKFNHKK